ncbi:MAG: DUF222 domain-containing protein [Acidimicrobiaceae bacterium]|nr:DUF222 domain-containing protein [Acidimicrobiaceae bacterium]
MVLADARQAVAAANRMLATLRDGGVASDELRAALEQTRVFMAAGTAFQSAAAELIAARERHGDGGAEVLAVSAGLSHSEARSQVKTARALRKVPKLRDAVQAGEVPQANARRLAEAITKTGSDAVAGDDSLLGQASSMRPEQFRRAAQRWITAQQDDDGASEHARQRAKRYLRFYDGEDGMVALHGEFDKITGTRIHNRIRHIAEQLLGNDRKLPKADRRQFAQCMADALDRATAPAVAADGVRSDGGAGWVADITLLAHVDDATGELVAELSDGSRLPPEVLEELSCNARWTGLVYDRSGDAIWRSRSRRTVTDTQWQALLTDYGGCFHCGAPPSMCQAHHIVPYSKGGETSVKNMVMVCWNCHHKIHHHDWFIETHSDGTHTLHPPDNPALQPRYGPAHADDHPPRGAGRVGSADHGRCGPACAAERPPAPELPLRRGRSPARPESKTSRTSVSTRARDPAPATLW